MARSVVRMKVGQQSLELHFARPEPSGLKSGDVLQATGVLLGNKIAVASSTVQAATTIEMCSTTGVQNTAVLLVTFPGVALPTGVTTQSLDDIFF